MKKMSMLNVFADKAEIELLKLRSVTTTKEISLTQQ